MLAEWMLGAAPESLPFPVTTVRNMPFRGTQMIGKGAAIWWMRMLDRLEIDAA